MKNMYYCQVWGDMSADSAADQYPTVAVCETCIKEQESLGEDNQIVTGGDEIVTDEDETCFFCDAAMNEDE